MLKFILKKLLLMIPMLIVISLIVYLGLKSTGVDPISSMIPPGGHFPEPGACRADAGGAGLQ